jgi:ferredoxin-NADP reductase
MGEFLRISKLLPPSYLPRKSQTRIIRFASALSTPVTTMKFLQAVLSTAILSSLAGAFTAPSTSNKRSPSAFLVRKSSQLFAEGGAPQYEKRTAILRQAEMLGEGTVMLHIDRDDDMPLDYKAGNVLALEIQQDDDGNSNEKNTEDTANNGGWMRGPYTVSRGSESSFDIMLKVVGDKSKRFALAEPGTKLRFGGKFKVPIYEGIQKDTTQRVVLLSTGVGVGPCVGAIEEMLADDDFSAKVDLFASFRTQGEVVYGEYLDSLVAKHPDQFQWKPIITSEVGRISDSEENTRMVINANANVDSVKDTHYHLIGNGQLVNEWKSGLAKAGVPDDKVTTEAYFNHKATSNQNAIGTIANVIAVSSAMPVV